MAARIAFGTLLVIVLYHLVKGREPALDTPEEDPTYT